MKTAVLQMMLGAGGVKMCNVLCVCTCVCVYVCVRVCMCVSMFEHESAHLCVSELCSGIPPPMHTHARTCTRTHKHAHTQTCTHTHKHARTRTHTHTLTHPCSDTNDPCCEGCIPALSNTTCRTYAPNNRLCLKNVSCKYPHCC